MGGTRTHNDFIVLMYYYKSIFAQKLKMKLLEFQQNENGYRFHSHVANLCLILRLSIPSLQKINTMKYLGSFWPSGRG